MGEEKQINASIEAWKAIPNYDGYYISNFGRVKRFNKISPHPKSGIRILKEKIMKPHLSKINDGRKDNSGYLRISFHYNGKNLKHFIHTLVANSFCNGKSVERKFVNHKDGNKHNNHYLNLEWVTSKENFIHAVNNGFINLVQDNVNNKRLTTC